MADNEKKGPRDISDLKARLGLKKQGEGAGAPSPGGPGQAPSPFQPASIPRPAAQAPLPSALTGMPSPSSVPPPPGFAPPPEAAPPPPDPRRDPFAAQQAAAAANLAAFYGVGQALPGDANSVQGDAIKKPKPWPLIGGGIALALVGLGVGYTMGNISVSRTDYNVTTEQAGKIRDEVDKIQKQVKDIAQLLLGPEIKKGGVNFEVIEKLKEIDLKEPDVTAKLFKTNYASFESSTVQQLFAYYDDVVVLSRQLRRHTMVTLNDKDALDKFIKANSGGGKAEKRLGVILDYSQKTPFSQLVELVGAPICPTAGATDCSPTEMKFGFRTSTGGSAQTRVLKGKPQESVFPMQPSELQQQILTGDTNLLAYEAYNRRNKDLVDTLGRLAETEKQVIGNLKKRAESAKLWTLF